MLRYSPIVLLLWIASATTASAQPIDFVARLEASSAQARSLGLHKLSADEKQSLNLLLNAVYDAGSASCSPTAPESPAPTVPGRRSTPTTDLSMTAFKARVDSDDGNVVSLDNGAILEITAGYLGYVGYRKRAILLVRESFCKLWIEGKRLYRCDLLRAPTSGSKASAEEMSISEVKARGEILVSFDGRLFEVDRLHTITTSLWLGPFDALLIGGYELVNLDSSDEPVTVTPLR